MSSRKMVRKNIQTFDTSKVYDTKIGQKFNIINKNPCILSEKRRDL